MPAYWCLLVFFFDLTHHYIARMAQLYDKSRFISVCHRLYERRFLAATDGNVSVRLDDGNLLCTPHGVCKGDLREEDLIVIDMDGRLVEGTRHPTTEMPLHLIYYSMRPDVNAVIHAHPIHCTALAAAGRRIPDCVFPEVMLSMGAVPLAQYATPSTDGVPESIKPFIRKHNAVLLQNHGAVVAGPSLQDAYYLMEKLEHTAHITIVAEPVGGAKRLTDEQVRHLISIAGTVYGIDVSKRTFEL
jgi:L-fuculose-phosphate aldolase